MTDVYRDQDDQHGHYHHSSRDPGHLPWTRSCDPDPLKQPETSSATQLASTPTTAVQQFSNLNQPTFPLSTPTLLLTTSLSSQPFTCFPSSSCQTPTLSSISHSDQSSSSDNAPQTLITSTSPGKALAASFSSTSTSTVLDIITTPSSSQNPSSSTFPPVATPPYHPNQHSNFISTMTTGAKVGSLIGLILFLLILLAISLAFCFRRRTPRYPRCVAQRPTSYARETERLTSSTPEPHMGIEVIESGKPKTSCDSNGVRWPEKVVLRGEAREIREWTEEYVRAIGEKGYERRVLESYGFWGRGG